MTASFEINNEKFKFPFQGWLGLSLVIVFWILNWALPGTRTHWGFFPLWLDVHPGKLMMQLPGWLRRLMT